MKDNFLAFLRDERGQVVSESVRRGHNVITNYGRLWLSHLLTWKTIYNPLDAAPIYPDNPHTNFRVRGMLVGGGNLPEISAVATLDAPLTVTTGPDVYIQNVEYQPDFPLVTAVRYKAVYGTAELSHSGSVIVSEAGLHVDKAPRESGADASIIEAAGTVVVSGLTKMTPLSVGRSLLVTNGDNPGLYRIIRYFDDTSVEISSPHTGADSGNPIIDWQERVDDGDSDAPIVAYKTFEGIVKSAGFSLEIQWDFRF